MNLTQLLGLIRQRRFFRADSELLSSSPGRDEEEPRERKRADWQPVTTLDSLISGLDAELKVHQLSGIFLKDEMRSFRADVSEV